MTPLLLFLACVVLILMLVSRHPSLGVPSTPTMEIPDTGESSPQAGCAMPSQAQEGSSWLATDAA